MNDSLRPVFKSSPQAAIIPERKGAPKYPWVEVQPGFSFVINSSEMKFNTARSFASRMQKKHNKKFRVINHGPEVGYEVACLSIGDEPASVESNPALTPNLNSGSQAYPVGSLMNIIENEKKKETT